MLRTLQAHTAGSDPASAFNVHEIHSCDHPRGVPHVRPDSHQAIVEKKGIELEGFIPFPFFPTIGLFEHRPFLSMGFGKLSRKKDPWQEWGR